MPKEYVLKRPVMDFNRLKKVSKELLEECKEDRKEALEALRYFRERVDENVQDDAATKAVTDCLKLIQTSKQSAVKMVELLIKVEDAETRRAEANQPSPSNNTGINLFDQLPES